MIKNSIGKRCKRCLTRDIVPGTTVDSSRVCNHCHDVDKGVKLNSIHFTIAPEKRLQLQKELDLELRNARGPRDYDAVVGFSGGKDSIYLLYKLKKEYPNLRILAATVNQSFLSDVGTQNVYESLKKLNIDHVFITPRWEFYKKFFKYLLEHRTKGGYKIGVYDSDKRGDQSQTGLCIYCHELVSDIMMVYAMQNEIPLHITGLSPGQPLYEFYHRPVEEVATLDNTPPFMYENPFTDEDRSYFWNPKRYPAGSKFPRMIFPYHVWDYDALKMRREIHQMGLVKDYKKTSPMDSNCKLNYIMSYIDMHIDGYFNMLPYFSFQIRNGMMDKGSVERLVKIMPWMAKFFNKKRIPVIREVEKMLDVDANSIIDNHLYQQYNAYTIAASGNIDVKPAGQEV
jgi:hypothetical protein